MVAKGARTQSPDVGSDEDYAIRNGLGGLRACIVRTGRPVGTSTRTLVAGTRNEWRCGSSKPDDDLGGGVGWLIGIKDRRHAACANFLIQSAGVGML
jgi:hypothetical protein